MEVDAAGGVCKSEVALMEVEEPPRLLWVEGEGKSPARKASGKAN